MATATLVLDSPTTRVQRVLARFELACPTLRDYQVVVEVAGRTSDVVLLPAAKRPKGTVEYVFTPRGGLRTVTTPNNLGPAQTAAVEDLAWALREALDAAKPAPAPASEQPQV